VTSSINKLSVNTPVQAPAPAIVQNYNPTFLTWRYGLIVGERLTTQDIYLYRLVFGVYPLLFTWIDTDSSWINQQGKHPKTIAPYQHKQKLKRYVQTINAHVRSVLSSIKYKITQQTPCSLLFYNHCLRCNKWSIICSIQFILPSIYNVQGNKNRSKQSKAWTSSALMLPYIMLNELTININLIETMVSCTI